MTTTLTIGIRFIMTFIFALATLTLFDTNPASLVFIYAIIATVANYVIEDLRVLPATDNTVISAMGGVIAAFLAWLMGAVLVGFRTTLATLLALALVIGLGEYFFRKYLDESEKITP